MEDQSNKVSMWTNLMDWLVYSFICLVLTMPFFLDGSYCVEWRWISCSLLLGFFFGLLNRIVRELVFIKELIKKNKGK